MHSLSSGKFPHFVQKTLQGGWSLCSVANAPSILTHAPARWLICLPACLPAWLPGCLPACLPGCLPPCLPACLRFCVSASMFVSASSPPTSFQALSPSRSAAWPISFTCEWQPNSSAADPVLTWRPDALIMWRCHVVYPFSFYNEEDRGTSKGYGREGLLLSAVVFSLLMPSFFIPSNVPLRPLSSPTHSRTLVCLHSRAP